MAVVKIGHARTSSGPLEGQVKITNYYSTGWDRVLRPKSAKVAEKSAAICEAVCNHSKIGYSQASRNTLRDTALRVINSNADSLSMEAKVKELSKIQVNDINAINTACWADCSSFMTFCALVGGADIIHGRNSEFDTNANTCGYMEEHFAVRDAYVVLKASKYTRQSTYLRRGDILLNSLAHTAMVLTDGSDAASDSWEYEDTISALELKLSIKEAKENYVKITFSLYKIESEVEEQVLDVSGYKLSYNIINLDNNTKISKTIAFTTQNKPFTINNLSPGAHYSIELIAKDATKDLTIVSAKKIFNTNYILPTAVSNLQITNLNVSFNKNNNPELNALSVSFKPTSSWGVNSYTKCYRLYLYVNGTPEFSSDTLVAPSSSKFTLSIADINKVLKTRITFGDAIQVGIHPGVKDINGNFFADPLAIKSSKALYIQNNAVIRIQKVFIKINNIFKLTFLHKCR